jgi:dipeptidyl-peptidase-4
MSEQSFPRQYARTRRFSLGSPRDLQVAPDGRSVLFVRSAGGADPVGCLWRLDVESGSEHLLVDPVDLLGGGAEELSPEERARRERARETATGVVRFATDRARALAVFTLSGRLFAVEVEGGGPARALPSATPVEEPRPDPDGTLVAYVSGGALRVTAVDGSGDRLLAEPESETVTYGLAEFAAAEEMDRTEGFWWDPAGGRLLVARADTAPVRLLHIADPADPARPPAEVRYPLAGTDNVAVSLLLLGLDGGRVPVQWDAGTHEYLARVDWSEHGLVLGVQSRDQRSLQLLSVDPATGATTLLREDLDPHWVHLVDGVPARTAAGELVWTVDAGGARRLSVGDDLVTPPELQVRAVLDVDGDTVLFSAWREPTEVGLFTWSSAGGVHEVAATGAPAVRSGRRQGGTTVVVEHTLERDGADVAVLAGGRRVATIASLAETPVLQPRVSLLRLGPRDLRAALLLPSGHEAGGGSLPVLLDPYGGPGAQRVLAARSAHLSSQWFAEQGFAVLVVDGRGTPGRGPEWERAVAGDLAGPALEDQVDGLLAAAASYPDLDLGRVAIRGWSFGGYLAALAVLRRPDVFHAAVAGAPVTDWALYDTHYTERYLGHPAREPGAYEGSGLLGEAAKLSRPLMLIHGLADDNVVVAHTLRLSAHLTAAGRPHTVLPLSGVTHMTPQEEVAENLLLLQLDFLKRALGL